MNPNSIEPESEKLSNPDSSLKHFYAQIESVPKLIEQARTIDQTLFTHFEEIQSTAVKLIDEFDQQKDQVLKHFDSWLLPAAKEILEGLSKDGEQLKVDLEETLKNLQEIAQKDWVEHAKQWARLYAKWHDRQALIQNVLESVANRTQALIDRDIKIINDYQTQSLSRLPETSEEFKDVEDRLKTAIEGPLKNLVELKHYPSELSIKQTSDWIANFHKKRQNYFDHVLMKIDSVVKDIVHTEDHHESESSHELESEILFMERELHHINEQIAHLKKDNKSEAEYLLSCLEGIKEHIDQLDFRFASKTIKDRLDKLNNMIAVACFRLEEIL